MISAIRLKKAQPEVDRRRDRRAKRKAVKDRAKRIFADLSAEEKDGLLKEMAVMLGLVKE